ncbi:MAG: hypothetical protein U0169_19410 [Polyangiaceae bacterium]
MATHNESIRPDQYRVKDGSAWANSWKIAAGVGALGLAGAGAGYASDPTRFAYAWLFAFFVFLTIGLGALFFVLIQHLTGAGWSVTVRRTAEFFASGLVVFIFFVIPILVMGPKLYPWLAAEEGGGHGAEHGVPASKGDHHGSGSDHGVKGTRDGSGHGDGKGDGKGHGDGSGSGEHAKPQHSFLTLPFEGTAHAQETAKPQASAKPQGSAHGDGSGQGHGDGKGAGHGDGTGAGRAEAPRQDAHAKGVGEGAGTGEGRGQGNGQGHGQAESAAPKEPGQVGPGEHGTGVGAGMGSAERDGNDASLEAALTHAEHEEHAHFLHEKSAYLNKNFWLIRAVLYVLAWTFLGWRFLKLSLDQDATKKHENTAKAQGFAPLATAIFAITITFAGVDWIMSLDPMWYSTMWGVYVFAGSVVAMFAVMILTLNALKTAGFLGESVTTEHFHDLGKLQFGFLVFWAYISFSQFFLIWYSNIPEEVTFYHRRWDAAGGAWQGITLLLVFGHFVVPFALLLSRNVKRKVAVLALGAAFILCMHVTELYWLVMPNYGDGGFAPHWMDAACFLGIGGIYLAWVFKWLTSHPLIPVGDPRLPRAVHHQV